MKAPNLFTPEELDPILASVINARFAGFLVRFCKEMHVNFEDAIYETRKILREAGVKQPGDELYDQKPEEIDTSAFNI